MANYIDSIYTALNNLRNIVADYIQAEDIIVATLTVTDRILFPSVFTWNNLINQLPTLLGTNQLVKTNFTGNITQTGGTNQLHDTEIGSITQGGSSVIVQTGDQWNYLKQTQVTDLEVLGHLTLPSDITIAGSSYTDDLVLNNATLQQTTTSGQINTLCATDFYNGDVRLSDNLTMIGGAGTYATLSNLIVNGTSALGLITGTTISDIYNLIALKAPLASPTFTGVATFTGNVVGLTKAMVGLSNVDNTSDSQKPISNATQVALNLKANLASPTFTGTVGGITKAMVGLGNVDNTADSAKPVSTAQQTAITARLAAFNGQTSANSYLLFTNSGGSQPTSTYFNSQQFMALGTNMTGQAEGVFFQTGNGVANVNHRAFSWRILTSTSTNNELMYLAKGGNLVVTGTITSPTITTINTNIALKSDQTYVDSQLLLKANNTVVSALQADVVALQTEVDDLLTYPNVRSISVGTVTTVESNVPASITNVGTDTNQILNYAIPRGEQGIQGVKGDKGDKGNKGDDGDRGPKGEDGDQGPAGDSSAATAAAIAAGTSAGVASASAIAAASSASSAAISAGESAASALYVSNAVTLQDEKLTLMQTKVDDINWEVTQIKPKVQNISSTGTITFVSGTLETAVINNSSTIYSAGNITSASKVVATDGFSGGILPTRITGDVINIGTNETLINNINIGGATTITNINGIVNFTNPFNSFIQQF